MDTERGIELAHADVREAIRAPEADRWNTWIFKKTDVATLQLEIDLAHYKS